MRKAKGPSPQRAHCSPDVGFEQDLRGFLEDERLREQDFPEEQFCNPVALGEIGGGPKTLWENYRPRATLRH